jgi:hypothetical protein
MEAAWSNRRLILTAGDRDEMTPAQWLRAIGAAWTPQQIEQAALPPRMQEALLEKGSPEQARAIRALGAMGAFARPHVPVLVKLVEDPSPSSDDALKAIAQLGVIAQDAVPMLAEHLGRDSRSASVEDYVRAVGRMGAAGMPALPALRTIRSRSRVQVDTRLIAQAIKAVETDTPLDLKRR